MKPLNATHELLLEYARTRYTLSPVGTVEQFTYWWGQYASVRISERTFQRHTKQLRDAGLISVRHTYNEDLKRTRTWYTLLDAEIEMPRVKFLPTFDPEVFSIVDDGTETIRHSDVDPIEAEHRKAMQSLEDLDLDALQDSWESWIAPEFLNKV